MEEAIVNAMRRLAEIIAGIPLNYQEIPDNKKRASYFDCSSLLFQWAGRCRQTDHFSSGWPWEDQGSSWVYQL